MDKKELMEGIASGSLRRRDLLRGLTALGIGVAVLPMVPGRARAAGEITYFTWEGYEIPELHGDYIKKHGGSPETGIFSDEEEAFQKMRAGYKPDVMHPCSYSVRRWRDAELLQPIDTGKLKNWADVVSTLKSLKGAQDGGKQWFVPFDWGNTSVLYRTDLVDIKEDSWGILFDEKYKGKIATFAGVDETVPYTSAYLGLDPWNLSEADLEKVRAMLKKQRDLVRFYGEDETSIEQALASGEIVAATTWNASVKRLLDQGVKVRYMKPKEGIITWCCGMVIHKDCKDVAAAMDFIDAMLSPETGRYMIAEYGYGHSNAKSFDLAGDEAINAAGLSRDVEGFLKGGIFSGEFRDREATVKMYEDVKAGL